MSVFTSLLNNALSIYRRTRTGDGQGGWSISYALNGTAVGRIRPAGGRERDIAMQEGREITHVLYVVDGTDIKRGDRVYVGDLIVDIEGVREPSLAGEHLEIDCRETQVEESEIVSGS